jgi:hypothetical protein
VKFSNFRSRKLLDLCRGQPCMLMLSCCTGGGEDTVAAHSNLLRHGKGTGEKASDVFTFPACAACHRELDQGFTLSKQQKEEAIILALDRWHNQRFELGLVKVAA